MIRALLLLALLALAACESVPKAPERPVVNVQIPVPCVDDMTPRPPAVSTDAQLKALTDDLFVLTLQQDRLKLMAWAAEVSPVLEACRILAGPR